MIDARKKAASQILDRVLNTPLDAFITKFEHIQATNLTFL